MNSCKKMTVYFGLNNTRKRALLLYQAGSRVRDIFAQLYDTGEANDFEAAKEKLAQHFKPQTNVRNDLYVFRKAFSKKMKLPINTIRNLQISVC